MSENRLKRNGEICRSPIGRPRYFLCSEAVRALANELGDDLGLSVTKGREELCCYCQVFTSIVKKVKKSDHYKVKWRKT